MRYYYFSEGTGKNIVRTMISSVFFEELSEMNAFKRDSLVLVGQYYSTETEECIYAYPKYLYENNQDDSVRTQGCIETAAQKKIREHLERLTEVMERLRQRGKNIDEVTPVFSPLVSNYRKKRVNIIRLAEYLLTDFMDFGIYYTEDKEDRRFGNGKTQWGKTVLRLQPIIRNHEVLYIRPFRRRYHQDYNNIFTALHCTVLSQCIEVLQKNGKFRNVIIEYEYNLNIVKDLEKYVSVLQRHMSSLFYEREINLFKALISWCEYCSKYYKNVGCTTSFHLVWEWVNDEVFGNINEDIIKHSENPIYHLGENDYRGSGDAEPDTLYYDSIKKVVTIYDSKYYSIRKIKNGKPGVIYGYPANSDIVKQIAYRLFWEKENYKVDKNIFLVPIPNDDIIKTISTTNQERQLVTELGYVKPGKFSLITEDSSVTLKEELEKAYRVDIWGIKPEILYDYYCSGKKYIN